MHTRCVMALLKGINGKCPCPVCLIPGENLLDLHNAYPLRQVSHGQSVMMDTTLRQTQKSAQLKPLGLRAIQVY